MPRWAGYTFRGWWQKRQQYRHQGVKAVHAYDPDRTVVYFHGCATNSYEPHVGRTAIAVSWSTWALTVIVPPLQCCGLPMQSNGDFDAARRYARRNVTWLEPYARQRHPVVGTSASCMMALKGDYEHILGMSDDATRSGRGGRVGLHGVPAPSA
jgi:glycerol-3-phosphate dehydrogenase subunit C